MIIPDARIVAAIAEAIDWMPTCRPGEEHRAIVRQVLMAAAPASPDPAAAKLREVADEIERFTKGSPDRLAYERAISWIRSRAHGIDGLHDPHPSEFEQALRWLQSAAIGAEPAAGHARRLLDDVYTSEGAVSG